MHSDSTGNKIDIDSKVRFRGQIYTIKNFIPNNETNLETIIFNEIQHTSEVATEFSVDLVL